MRPPERRDSGQHDLLRSRLDRIVDLAHPLAKLARTIDWGFLERRLGAVYTDKPGRPPLPTRLMAGLAILKHMHNLSDEATTSPMKRCASTGWRTRITSCCAARSSSATSCRSIARR